MNPRANGAGRSRAGRFGFLYGPVCCLAIVLGLGCTLSAQSAGQVKAAITAEVACLDAPPVELSKADFIVRTEPELQRAVAAARAGDSVLIKPGVYALSATLAIKQPDITIHGDSQTCDDIVLLGPGMEQPNYGNAPHGFWIDAAGANIRNLAISGFYHHAITFGKRATAPALYNLRLRDAGEQFVKVNWPGDTGVTVDDGLVEYSLFYYSAAPPNTDHGGGGTGYTNGVDVHAGQRWVIRNNYFGNFHTPDSARNRWNPAILMWNGAADTLVENNRFVDVDRAIAFGLIDRPRDHSGGVIRNNMIYYRPNLMSRSRRRDSDAAIIVWSSPASRVIHNTIVTNGNLRRSIEFRFDTGGGIAANNLVDAPVGSRQGGRHDKRSNSTLTSAVKFREPLRGDLHLQQPFQPQLPVKLHADARLDIDGQSRDSVRQLLPGADQLN